MPFGNSLESKQNIEKLTALQSQRDCVHQPRVARNELPWVWRRTNFNPNGVAAGPRRGAATPLGLGALILFPKVARASQPWALRRNPFGIQLPNSRKALRLKEILETVPLP
jgi:hypothetical protein